MSAAPERRHWRFTGQVQGVGFRYRAQYAAQRLGLTGWVENNWDGSVEMEAQGPPEQLDRLVPTLTATSQWMFCIQRTAARDVGPGRLVLSGISGIRQPEAVSSCSV